MTIFLLLLNLFFLYINLNNYVTYKHPINLIGVAFASIGIYSNLIVLGL